MKDVVFKNKVISLPAGYTGFIDMGEGLEICDVLFAVVQISETSDSVDSCIIYYKGIIGETVPYVVTRNGRVTDGESWYENLESFRQLNPDMQWRDC